MAKVYISDTNIRIDFANADLLAEIFKLSFNFCCTDFVLDEIDMQTHQSLLGLGLKVEPMTKSALSIEYFSYLFHYRTNYSSTQLC